MKILKLPFFVISLVWQNFANLIQLIVFKFSISKLVVINILLTLVIIGLSYVWTSLPYPKSISPPAIGLNTENSQEASPTYFTWNQDEVVVELEKYQDKALKQDFISQTDYINLAVLTHAAGKYEQANEYLELAKHIDSNRDFFVK